MLLGGVFQATANRSPAMEPVEAKRAYLMRDMQRWIEHRAVPFTMNPHFPINTLRIMRTCLAARRAGVFDRFHPAVFRAFWAEGRNLGDEEVLAGVLEGAGLDARSLLAAAGEQVVKDELREVTEEAVRRGVFGAPTFFVGDEMFFGQDRLDFVERALAR